MRDKRSITVSYDKIREWASECDDVRRWMEEKEELKEVFALTIEVGRVYASGSNLYQCVKSEDDKYALHTLFGSGGAIGWHNTLESLSTTSAYYNHRLATKEEILAYVEKVIHD